MRRKILIALGSLLGLALALLAVAFWYVRSGRLDNLVQREIIAALKESGTTASIERTHLDLRGYKVTLENIQLETEKEGKPFGSIGSIEVEFSVLDYLRQKLSINRVIISQPRLTVEFDEQGRLNLDSLRAPERKDKDADGQIKFSNANIELIGGEVSIRDRSRNLTVDLVNLSISLTPLGGEPLTDKLNHALALEFDRATAVYKEQKIEPLRSRIEADIRPESADVKKIEIDSPLGHFTASGRALSFKPFKYDVAVRLEAATQEIARVFAPDAKVEGQATFNGRVEGEGAEYRASGNLESNALTAEGFRISALRLGAEVDGSGQRYDARAEGGVGSVSGKGLTIGSMLFKEAAVIGEQSQFDVTGGVSLSLLRSGVVTASGIRLRLSADSRSVRLSQISASILGGRLTGSATLALSGGESKVDVEFEALELGQAATLASAKEIKARGTARGTARLAFPGLNFKAAAGRLEASFEGAVSPPESSIETLPASGEIIILATGRTFQIEKAFARTAASEVTVSGTADLDGNAKIEIDFKSSDMGEAQRVIDAFGFIPEKFKEEYGFAVAGEGRFIGRVEGKVSSPSVTGHVRLDEIRMHQDPTDDSTGEKLGSFEGDIAYSPALLRVEGGKLARPDGTRADFSLDAPLDKDDAVAIRAVVRDFDLASLVRTATPEFKDFVGAGVINGTIDLRGLPGRRTVSGTADVSISSARFIVPSSEEGKEAEPISVPEFVGEVAIENSVMSVKDLRMQVGDARIVGQGSFNLDTYQYSINAEGKEIDLERLSLAATSDSVHLTGQANLAVEGDGKWDEWSDIRLKATIQGENVTLNGRDIGAARVVAFTQSGLLKIEATGRLLDREQTLAAVVDLRDRKNYPISGSVEFTDADIGPYLELLSPEMRSITGRATGTIKLSGPLQDTDQIQAVLRVSRLELGGDISTSQKYTITNQGDLVIVASPGEIKVERVTFTGEGTSVVIEGAISRDNPARSLLAINGELNLRLVSSFTDTIFTTGVAQVQASIGGSIQSPRLLGSVNLRDLGLRVTNIPLTLTRGAGRIRFTSDQALIENFTASSAGGGTLKLSGGAALVGLVPDRWRIEAEANEVGIEYPRDTQTIFDGTVALQGNRRAQVLTGDIDVRRASYQKDLTLEELVSTGGPLSKEFVDIGPGNKGGPGLPIAIDMRINADQTLIIRNNLADAEGSAYLHIRGPLSDPVVSGRVVLSHGILEFRDDKYELIRGVITFPARRKASPVLDVESEVDISGYTITLTFTGTMEKPEITLRSNPDLPETDIISLITSGSLATDTSASGLAKQSGLGLAQSLLSASLTQRLSKGTQRLFGLSRLSIDPLIVGGSGDPTAKVTLGQRITRNLTITYSQNLTSRSSGFERIVLLEYRLTNRFSLVGFRNERNEFGFDVRVRKRF
jgi:translocation and assembly module TamB